MKRFKKMDALDLFAFIITGVRYEYGEWKPFIIQRGEFFYPKKEREFIKFKFWGMKKTNGIDVSEFRYRLGQIRTYDSLESCKESILKQMEKIQEIRHEL